MSDEQLTNEAGIPPKQAIHDLVLALIYLTRFMEKSRYNSEDQLFRAWKTYDWDALDKLSEEELIIDRHGNKSLYLTDEGVARAQEILKSLGIRDWEKR